MRFSTTSSVWTRRKSRKLVLKTFGTFFFFFSVILLSFEQSSETPCTIYVEPRVGDQRDRRAARLRRSRIRTAVTLHTATPQTTITRVSVHKTRH